MVRFCTYGSSISRPRILARCAPELGEEVAYGTVAQVGLAHTTFGTVRIEILGQRKL